MKITIDSNKGKEFSDLVFSLITQASRKFTEFDQLYQEGLAINW